MLPFAQAWKRATFSKLWLNSRPKGQVSQAAGQRPLLQAPVEDRLEAAADPLPQEAARDHNAKGQSL